MRRQYVLSVLSVLMMSVPLMAWGQSENRAPDPRAGAPAPPPCSFLYLTASTPQTNATNVPTDVYITAELSDGCKKYETIPFELQEEQTESPVTGKRSTWLVEKAYRRYVGFQPDAPLKANTKYRFRLGPNESGDYSPWRVFITSAEPLKDAPKVELTITSSEYQENQDQQGSCSVSYQVKLDRPDANSWLFIRDSNTKEKKDTHEQVLRNVITTKINLKASFSDGIPGAFCNKEKICIMAQIKHADGSWGNVVEACSTPAVIPYKQLDTGLQDPPSGLNGCTSQGPSNPLPSLPFLLLLFAGLGLLRKQRI
jgi:MYXO-CTERM domain-containing protein